MAEYDEMVSYSDPEGNILEVTYTYYPGEMISVWFDRPVAGIGGFEILMERPLVRSEVRYYVDEAMRDYNYE